MDRQEWRQAIVEVPVFDTHTHLNMPGVPIPARNFWDIAHYFWLLEELWSVGYPRHAEELPEEERIEHFVRAFEATRNTAWHQIVRAMFRTLYGIELGDAESVRRANAAVQESFRQPEWSRQVIDRLHIRRIAVNTLSEARFPELPGVGVAVPSRGGFSQEAWAKRILDAPDQRAAGREARAELLADVGRLYRQGIRGMRVDVEPLERLGQEATDDLPVEGTDRAQVDAFLTHALLHALGEHGMFAQLFLGIRRDVTASTSMAVNDPERIVRLYPLFERYACGFELVIGAPQNNLDAAQPARIYPNVHLGGLWWYNFRSSTYRQVMQYRLEAVPASKSALVASDARCIEWCYAKILLVKRLLADFLYDQIELGWISREDALWVAQEWLHDAAARRYLATPS
jgi:hypothetical protein